MNRRHLVAAAGLLFAALVVVAWANPALLIVGYEEATVTVTDDDSGATLATVDARVADGPVKQYVGLSATESLDPDEGMLFVHDESAERAYVMREMAFAIDILFVSADGAVTEIHRGAEPEEPPYTRYEGEGLYVLEVRAGYADERGIEVGDEVRIERDD
ncbi:hypothetical protein GCM10027435_10760 [Haloparvum alkalitolerans]|uniref:DUF192 domain-containing protein n=1 Tax=Haloparvum alkalitolerans TaxID=1042953 RepID=UPI003CE7A722